MSDGVEASDEASDEASVTTKDEASATTSDECDVGRWRRRLDGGDGVGENEEAAAAKTPFQEEGFKTEEDVGSGG